MNSRDIELLSAYLDGQLKPSDSARIESRLSSDPDLRAVMDELREARGLLRQLPARKAPRNFTLTRKMVGLKPPLPRAYPTFRFASALAAFLLFISFAVNTVTPRLSFSAAASAYELGGVCDGCGGGGPEAQEAATEAPAEVPAATELLPEPPAATEPPAAPSLAIEVTPTGSPVAADNARTAETPTPKEALTESVAPQQARGTQVQTYQPVPVNWQIGLALIGLVSAVIAFLMRRSAIQKWK